MATPAQNIARIEALNREAVQLYGQGKYAEASAIIK